ncbi:MAG: glutathione S-transferase family protein [Deltaproteobacteria bacterium]|nr:glutathione S-transferase family protein [Deltaproteobacteria bacterium]
MPSPYRLFGLELSPYSVKVRSYLRYKGIEHEWVVRDSSNVEEYQRRARLPLIPLLITPEDEVLQDSTPMIEALESRFPEPSIHPSIQPAGPAEAFLSALLEEYADEWGNKPMFHYRWWYEADRESAARRIATASFPEADGEALEGIVATVQQRMVPRLSFVGSSEQTRGLIEASFGRQMRILETHLEGRDYIFGGRPAFADFGLWGQLYNLHSDPTAGAVLEAEAPRLVDWIRRMLEPRAEGDFEPWHELAPTLEPLLEQEVGAIFLPWSSANAEAIAAGEKSFRVELAGQDFSQEAQKYHARSLAALKARYQNLADRSELDPILERTGCLAWLQD